MAISFVGTGSSYSTTSSGTSYTLNKPSDVTTGDLMIAFVVTEQNSTVTPPSGWTTVRSVTLDSASDDVALFILKRTATSSEPATWTDGTVSVSSTRRGARVLAYRGADTAANQFIVENGNTDAADTPLTRTTPSVNNTGDGSEWRVAAFLAHDNAVNIGSPAWGSYTGTHVERFDDHIGGAVDPTLTYAAIDSNGAVATGSASVTGTWTPGGSATTMDTSATWVGIIKAAPAVPTGSVDKVGIGLADWNIWIDWDKDYGANLTSFETGTVEGWTGEGNPAPLLSVASEGPTQPVKHGFYSMLVSWTIDTNPVDPVFTFGVAGQGLDDGKFNVQNPPVVGAFVSPTVERTLTGLIVGRSYTATAWVYVPDNDLNVRLQCAGTNGSFSGVSGQYTQISVTFTATATTHVLAIDPESDPFDGTELLYVDHVQVLHTDEDVKDRVLGVRTPLKFKRGRDGVRALEAMTPSDATFELDNDDQELSPNNPGSIYSGFLMPGRPIYVRADYDDHFYSLFYGFLDEYALKPGKADKSVEFSAMDLFAQLGQYELSTEVHASLQTGEVLHVILDEIGWPRERRGIDHGATTVAWWSEESTTALEAVKRIVDSEGLPAFAYVDPNGNFIFRDRHHRALDPRSKTSQQTFYSGSSVEEPSFCEPVEYEIGWSDLINQVKLDVPIRAPREIQEVWKMDSATHIQLFTGVPYEITIEASSPFINAIAPVDGAMFYNEDGAEGNPGANDEEYKFPAFADFIIRPAGPTVTTSISRTSGKSLTITYTASANCTISDLRLRAAPIEEIHKVRVLQEDSTSIEANGPRTYDGEMTWANPLDVEAIARVILGQRAERLPIFTFTLNNGGQLRYENILKRNLSDRIHIFEGETFTDSDFYIESIEHNIQDVGWDHRATFSCEQARDPATPNVFTFGTAGKGLDQGVFGGVGFVNPADYFILGQTALGTGKLVF